MPFRGLGVLWVVSVEGAFYYGWPFVWALPCGVYLNFNIDFLLVLTLLPPRGGRPRRAAEMRNVVTTEHVVTTEKGAPHARKTPNGK